MDNIRNVRPRDLPTKLITMSDESTIEKKVVQAESHTLGADLLAAFRWNVRRILDERKSRTRCAEDSTELPNGGEAGS